VHRHALDAATAACRRAAPYVVCDVYEQDSKMPPSGPVVVVVSEPTPVVVSTVYEVVVV
jgi:hypothetical protein